VIVRTCDFDFPFISVTTGLMMSEQLNSFCSELVVKKEMYTKIGVGFQN
jgi:hypothetical protein